MIANHYTDGQYNSTSGKIENKTNEIIALSYAGQVLWRESLDSFNGSWASFNAPSVSPNGTFVIYGETEINNQSTNFKFGYDRLNGNYYSDVVDWIPYNTSNGPNSLYYDVRADSETKETTIYYCLNTVWIVDGKDKYTYLQDLLKTMDHKQVTITETLD